MVSIIGRALREGIVVIASAIEKAKEERIDDTIEPRQECNKFGGRLV